MTSAVLEDEHGAWSVRACYGGMMCVALASNLAPVYLTTFGEVFGGPGGLTEEQLGRIPAFMFAMMVLGILVSGPLADRWGGRPAALAGLACTAAGLGLLARADSYSKLVAASAVMGFGGGVLDMVLSPIVCALRPRQRARALNRLHAFYCVGAVSTVAATALGIRLGISWRLVTVALTALPLGLFLVFAALPIPPLVHEALERTPARRLLAQPFFLAALCAIALCGATEQGMAQWLPAYAERGLGFGRATGGVALALFSVCMIAGRFAAGAAARHVLPARLIQWSGVCCVVTYLAGAFLPHAGLALAASIAVGLAVSSLWPTMLSIAADHFPQGGASMFSLMAAAGNLGCFVTPWAVGALAESRPLSVALAAVAVCPLILAVGIGRLSRHAPVS